MIAKLKDDIKIIPGHTHILLIAPHGKATIPKDEIITDKITLTVADMLGCSAIVNDVFSRKKYNFIHPLNGTAAVAQTRPH